MYVSGNRSLRWCSNTNNLSLTGQGVNAYGVSQTRDQYIDKRYRENTAVEAETEKKVNILSDVEDVLDNIDTDGLQYYTEQYFKALQDYSVERPDAAEVATIAVNSATNLCRILNDYSTKLREVEDTYVSETKNTVTYVNNLLSEMNQLNKRIAKEKMCYPDEYGPNELYDQLNMYIDELANYGDISVTKHSNGTISVDMAGVNVLNAEKFKTNSLVMQDYYTNGQVVLNFESGEEVNLHSGVLKAYIDSLNGNGVYATGRQNGEHGIAYYKSAIDIFARTLADTFNAANGADDDPARQMFVGYPSGGKDPTADENKDGVLDGNVAFKLHDTYGFPIEMTVELAKERNLTVDTAGFEEAFRKHQELSHQGAEQKFKGGLADTSEETARLHTATHLLHAALRKVLGDEVAQKGSNITAERLRFDFSFGRKVTKDELAQVEKMVNEAIQAKVPVVCEEMTVPEAKEKGAIGLFESKYGEKVRTYKMGDYSFEICGGPHAQNTRDLGTFKIQKEESSSAGVRRIKAVLIPDQK